MAALHVGSERLLAGFDDWRGSHTLDALRGQRINVLESPEGCCEDICTFCLGIINGFGISRRLL